MQVYVFRLTRQPDNRTTSVTWSTKPNLAEICLCDGGLILVIMQAIDFKIAEVGVVCRFQNSVYV